QSVDDPVQCLRRAHDLCDLGGVGAVVPADLRGGTLRTVELGDDLLLLGRQVCGDRAEGLSELSILRLLGQLLSPVQAEVEVAAAVVDRAELADRKSTRL